jgi:hypothetical protein
MTTSASRDRISVDLRGMKQAVLARARVKGVTPSALIRTLLGEAVLEEVGRPAMPKETAAPLVHEKLVRLSLRMERSHAQQLMQQARAAGLPAGTFVGGLCAGIPALVQGQRPAEQMAAIAASSAELSTLARDLRHLTQLLRLVDAPAAQAYRERLGNAERDIRAHLALAADLLAELRPLRRRV